MIEGESGGLTDAERFANLPTMSLRTIVVGVVMLASSLVVTGCCKSTRSTGSCIAACDTAAASCRSYCKDATSQSTCEQRCNTKRTECVAKCR